MCYSPFVLYCFYTVQKSVHLITLRMYLSVINAKQMLQFASIGIFILIKVMNILSLFYGDKIAFKLKGGNC